MVCLRSGESELMALVGGACMGIYNVRPMEQGVQLLTWDDCFMHGQRSGSGFVKRKGAESTHSPRLFYCKPRRWNLVNAS